MVFTDDIQQIDAPYLDAPSNGLAYMIDKMKGQELFAYINLIQRGKKPAFGIGFELVIKRKVVIGAIFI